MASASHTFGAKCRLAPVPRAPHDNGTPPVDAQFFYSSLIPIDDPLSTTSTIGAYDSKSSRRQLRPFGRGDNAALEKAWLALGRDSDRCHHRQARAGRSLATDLVEDAARFVAQMAQDLAIQHRGKHRSTPRSLHPTTTATDVPASTSTSTAPCSSELLQHVSRELQDGFCSLARRRLAELSLDNVIQEIVAATNAMRKSAEDSTELLQGGPKAMTPSRAREEFAAYSRPRGPLPQPKLSIDGDNENEPRSLSAHHASKSQLFPQLHAQSAHGSFASAIPITTRSPVRATCNDGGISGKPFVRVGSIESSPPFASSTLSRTETSFVGRPSAKAQSSNAASHDTNDHFPGVVGSQRWTDCTQQSVEIVVGVSRLHNVSLPTLQMKPIYWSPINDVAAVLRATWFYRDTMMPVAAAVANQLEAGYQELRPWTETWHDEIRCALEVGPLGEEKVSHCLWPEDSSQSSGPKDSEFELEPAIASDPYCAARCFHGEAASQGTTEPALDAQLNAKEHSSRPFANYHVFYKDSTLAFLLKPSLKPSAYYGRKPVQKITRGITVGVPVTRGFDQRAWDRLHDKVRQSSKPAASAAQESHESSGLGVCPACEAEKNRNQVTDLVLVAHGIGQKFAERVESFHFTHAINGFRRAVNMEMANPLVQRVLRREQNGLMILPLNWRMGLSFEDGGLLREEDVSDYAPETFALKDIEPDTIPAIRSMMSDVMFDIPFYMSQHKSKMINALVSEANRVYRLWCRNNPGFANKGRVHLIAHSLGSAMALDILSRQPTWVPSPSLSEPELETRHFEFDTTNLFLVGSPAGFFLLLERGALMPRRGRRKPGAEAGDVAAKNVVANAGTFGCLAVDNIYNVLAKEDPIAYLLNGAVDPAYSASLETAYVPSTSTSLLKSLGDAMRKVVPGMSPTPDRLTSQLERPPTVRLPSQLEMEVHDFTREEIAEKKAFLLNDNGQIDWFLRSGGGPLEIQYLNMLSAHSSYWYNQDFIRMLCIEIGRQPGRANTLPAMRAAKATKRFSTAK